MIYVEPSLDAEDRAVLRLIGEQRQRLAAQTRNNPRRWTGSLRRRTFARAIQGSNSIEGYNATVDQAIGVVEDEAPDERTETWSALSGYRNALTYVMQAARDADFTFNRQLLKSLHFMMLSYDLGKNPGQWRPGAIWIESGRDHQVVYVAPEREDLDELIAEFCDYVRADVRQDLLVKAAMVHLNLTLIHPFSDGNGRMARAMQTLILALDGLIDPVFSSIEEWLGTYTDEYYAVLTEVAQGRWSPQRSAHPWVRFCLRAHYQQASTVLRRSDEYSHLYTRIERLAARHGLNDRVLLPLFDAASGATLTGARYQEAAGVNPAVASRDLRRLTELGLLEARGETRGRRYHPAAPLVAERQAVRIRRPLRDPYQVVREAEDQARQGRLPLEDSDPALAAPAQRPVRAGG